MPFTTVEVIEGVFSQKQKARLIEKITEAMVGGESEGMRPFTRVVIEEVKAGDWVVGVNLSSPSSKHDSPRAATHSTACDPPGASLLSAAGS